MLENQENDFEHKEDVPEMYWVKLSDIDQDTFDSVFKILRDVYKIRDKKIFEKPNYKQFQDTMATELALCDWNVLGYGGYFEARRRIGGDGTLYVRFKSSIVKTDQDSDESNRRIIFGKDFQQRVDDFFLEKGVAVKLSQTF